MMTNHSAAEVNCARSIEKVVEDRVEITLTFTTSYRELEMSGDALHSGCH